MKQTLFVTATDTGVGKTLVCGLLLRLLKEQGVVAGYQKWVSTGGATSADMETVAGLAEMVFLPEELGWRVPYCFALPASPHLAAELAGRAVDPERIMAAMRIARAACEVLVVEGVGGALVPLNRELLLADLMARVGLPTLIVARSGLGTLNHTLLTIEALRARRIPILGVMLTDSGPQEEERIAADNLRTIAALGQVPGLGRLPWCEDAVELPRHFAPIGEKILSRLSE